MGQGDGAACLRRRQLSPKAAIPAGAVIFDLRNELIGAALRPRRAAVIVLPDGHPDSSAAISAVR